MTTPTASAEWLPIGNHMYRFEPPDLFSSRVLGDVCRADVERTYDLIVRFSQEHGGVYWIADVTRLGHLLPDARATGSRTDQNSRVLGLAIVGASFHQRVLVTLGIKASRLLQRSNPSRPVGFFSSEAEARAWVDAERRRAKG